MTVLINLMRKIISWSIHILTHHNVYGKYLILYVNYTSTKAEFKKKKRFMSSQKRNPFPAFLVKFKKVSRPWKKIGPVQCIGSRGACKILSVLQHAVGTKKDHSSPRMKKNKWSQTGPWDLKKCCQSLKNENHEATDFGADQSTYGRLCLTQPGDLHLP